jgi:nitrate/nitrite transporter NarK
MPPPTEGVAETTSRTTERTPLLNSHPTATESHNQQEDQIDSKPSSIQDGGHYRGIDSWHFWWLFSGILFGTLITFFDSSMMASSHPVITSYFHASNSASWLSTVFYLTSTVFQPIYGRVSDTVGRRPLYLFAISVFLATTAWCALAQNIGSFIFAPNCMWSRCRWYSLHGFYHRQ